MRGQLLRRGAVVRWRCGPWLLQGGRGEASRLHRWYSKVQGGIVLLKAGRVLVGKRLLCKAIHNILCICTTVSMSQLRPREGHHLSARLCAAAPLADTLPVWAPLRRSERAHSVRMHHHHAISTGTSTPCSGLPDCVSRTTDATIGVPLTASSAALHSQDASTSA